jgi:hypothetical protein
MKRIIIMATLLLMLASFVGIGLAETEIITGELVDIAGEMYTVKTESEQGFRGSRSTFHVDPKSTKKSGDLKIGMKVQAEIDHNGHAQWVKPLEKILK